MSRPVATPDDFTLSIDEVVHRYEQAGHPRTVRSIQRYCARGDLDCLRQETPFGEKYLISPASVARHLAQIAEVAAATGRDMAWRVGIPIQVETAAVSAENKPDTPRPPATLSSPVVQHDSSEQIPTDPGVPRQAATSSDFRDRYIERLEGEVTFLREEVSTKNSQIKELTERSRETNVLIGGLQKMLSPLLGKGDTQRPDPHNY